MESTSVITWETRLSRLVEKNQPGLITSEEFEGKDLNRVIYGDSTPLDLAFYKGNFHAMWDLLDAGASRLHRSYNNFKDGRNIQAIALAYEAIRKGDNEGKSEDALTFFAATKNPFWVEKLLKEGVTPYAIKSTFTTVYNSDIQAGQSAMKAAIDNGDTQCVGLLLNHGYSTDHPVEGMPLEKYALSVKQEDVLALIMSKKAREATQSLLDECIKPAAKP